MEAEIYNLDDERLRRRGTRQKLSFMERMGKKFPTLAMCGTCSNFVDYCTCPPRSVS